MLILLSIGNLDSIVVLLLFAIQRLDFLFVGGNYECLLVFDYLLNFDGSEFGGGCEGVRFFCAVMVYYIDDRLCQVHDYSQTL